MELKGCGFKESGLYVCTYSAFLDEEIGDLKGEIHHVGGDNPSKIPIKINVC